MRAQGVDLGTGLSAAEAEQRLRKFGPNQLLEKRPVSRARVLLNQFASWIVALLAVAALVSFAFQEWVDGAAILLVLALNTLIGFVTELRAMRSMEALRKLGCVQTRVRRDGHEHHLPATELVPGDVLVLDAGDMVTADLRILEDSRLEADESALTGESVPVAKSSEAVAADTIIAERASMLFKGTSLTRGSALGVVVATGMQTELGRIAHLVQETQSESTPLEKQLASLGRWLIWAVVAVAIMTAVLGISAGRPALLMIETGVALAVAAIPEGLPVVATIALARGMWRMARRAALVNRLSAVETLGATTVIFSDKTGTLTENRMRSQRLVVAGKSIDFTATGETRLMMDGESVQLDALPGLQALVEATVLCNNAKLGATADDDLGDPTELALLHLGDGLDVTQAALHTRLPKAREEAFDSESRMMATAHRDGEHYRFAIKGASEAVLQGCTEVVGLDGARQTLDEAGREAWNEYGLQLAEDGLRVLAIAQRTAQSPDEAPYQDLTLLGLVGMADPPRAEVREALAACQGAGIEVIMVTGDHAGTAAAIARDVGLVDEKRPKVRLGSDPLGAHVAADTRVYARVAPEQKLDLIAAYQKEGHVVAMTGDGVNDAPALRKADIGIAMGLRGTQVAREAADMVLVDDAFASIVIAIEQGRVIFDNIRRVVIYLLSCNVSEVLVVALAPLIGGPLPLLPLQILFINLVTDVFPALALAFGEGDRAILKRPPRDPAEPIVTRRGWAGILAYAFVLSASVLTALMLAQHWLGYSSEAAVTVSFLTLAAAQLWHVFDARTQGSSPWRNEITANPWVWGSLAIGISLLACSVYLPGLRHVLETQAPDPAGWGLILVMSLLPLFLGQLYLTLSRPK